MVRAHKVRPAECVRPRVGVIVMEVVDEGDDWAFSQKLPTTELLGCAFIIIPTPPHSLPTDCLIVLQGQRCARPGTSTHTAPAVHPIDERHSLLVLQYGPVD